MGVKDIRLKVYLSDERRYADIWNGSVFQGKEIVKAQDLKQVSPVLDTADVTGTEEMLRDVVMKQSLTGQKFALWTVENQEYVDYGMPVRIMRQEVMSYSEQIRKKKKENAKEELQPGGEYLYKIKKDDKIYPVSTLVVYWGKEEWDGPKSLHDIIDWGTESEEIKKLVPEYPIHFLDLSKIEHPEYFKTELRPFFELYRNRNNKVAFIDYLRNSQECSKMDDESWDVLGKVTNSPKLIGEFKNKVVEKAEYKVEEGTGMCRALQEFYDDGIAEGQAIKLIEMVCRKMAKGKGIPQIADELEEDEIIIEKIYDAAIKFSPGFDVTKIYDMMYKK